MSESIMINILAFYSVISAICLIVFGFIILRNKRRFAEIDIERLNIVEPDGKLKIVISNNRKLPDPIIDGKVLKNPRDESGIIFYNDEGDECGGLGFSGKKVDGKLEAGCSLCFDQYQQDQTVELAYNEGEGKRSTSLRFIDRPEISLPELLSKYKVIENLSDSEKKDAIKKMRDEGLLANERVYIGKDKSKTSKLVLSDAQGKARLSFRVSPDGKAEIIFFDESGKTIKTITGVE